ncbi:DUF1043 family protein [Exilibacterium tricleocarpae]|uniref:Z-ring associated protein G n=1 Tax=Exilibacterium tricleocarpae TaxID=2591008 RepID=A0A545TSM4_9GAMM|nr:DUF1043 family protein [Exilibacterium tricleocarpae]
MSVGCVVGALLSRSLNPREKQNRDLEQRLQQAEQRLSGYQQEVTEHFAQTSQLVNSLTQSYREVHEYLASSALKLSNPDVSRQILEAGKGKLPSDNSTVIDKDNFEPPRDWAPKEPGSKGALSEDYGLEEDREELAAATVNRD